MDNLFLMEFLKFATELAEKAGKHVLSESRKDFKIGTKRHENDLVTSIDQSTEKLIIKSIKSAYPDHAIIAEESTFFSSKDLTPEDYMKSDYIWIIDPIDGTTNFAHGLYYYAISIALFKTSQKEKSKNYDYLEGELVTGVTYAPRLGDMFTAQKNKGAFLNGDRLHVSKTPKLKNSLMATGFPANERKINFPYVEKISDHCRAVRRFGAATLDFAYTAAGHFDGYWEFGLQPWDVAVGALLVDEAGGKVSDSNGNIIDLFGQDILVSNGKIHKEIIELFHSF